MEKTAKRDLKDRSSANESKRPKKTEEDPEKLHKMKNGIFHKIQGQINSKLKWKSSFIGMKGTDTTKGGRVEVVCNDPGIFHLLFEGSTIKEAKDVKLFCTFKTEDEVDSLPFHGKLYRYNSTSLRAPCSVSLKDSALIFSFIFSVN